MVTCKGDNGSIVYEEAVGECVGGCGTDEFND